MTTECNICINTFEKKRKKITCEKCNYSVCLECQTTFSQSKCMSCQFEFTDWFVKNVLGEKFIKEVTKPNEIKKLMFIQKNDLSTCQPLIKWKKECKEIKDKKRFGIIIPLPPKPSLTYIGNEMFNCPKSNCRGFVNIEMGVGEKLRGICGVCKIFVCWYCHESIETQTQTQTQTHVCNPNSLQNINEIKSNSKSCPKCSVKIFKSSGCNHMHCTNCDTHFDWSTGVILNNSTNHHYRNLQAFNTRVNNNTNNTTNTNNNVCNEFSLYNDKIPIDVVNIQDDELKSSLYTDSNAVRLAKRLRYNEPNLTINLFNTLEELKVKYLTNEINETQWGNQVYMYNQKYKLDIMYANIFNLYLSTIDNLQSLLYNKASSVYEIKNQLKELIILCNDCFFNIQKDYGGILIKIKNITDYNDINIPSIIL